MLISMRGSFGIIYLLKNRLVEGITWLREGADTYTVQCTWLIRILMLFMFRSVFATFSGRGSGEESSVLRPHQTREAAIYCEMTPPDQAGRYLLRIPSTDPTGRYLLRNDTPQTQRSAIYYKITPQPPSESAERYSHQNYLLYAWV